MGRNSHLLPFSVRGCQLSVRGQRGGKDCSQPETPHAYTQRKLTNVKLFFFLLFFFATRTNISDERDSPSEE
jgi:hypothetical protein